MFTLPKSARLLRRGDFFRVRRPSTYLNGKFVAISYCSTERPEVRMGITVSRKYGKAHDRNRFKRVVRETYRHLRPDLPGGVDFEVRPRVKVADMKELEMLEELKRLIVNATKPKAERGS
ncbi:MAG: ribonuclease P protein component [Simkaniaceae bacterium]|nr:ribonuclease P protein component [Simkaniaceae bacterium]